MSTTDIIPTTNDIALGPGWNRLEAYRGESFRWVGGDATLIVATVRPVEHQVSIQLEPGPGVGLKRFPLQVLDASGATLAELDVRGRQTLSFALPAGPPRIHTLVFHTEEGGKTSASDPRVLNYRVFKISVSRMPSDIVIPGSGYRLGTGWYPLEKFNGESFRWVNNDAAIEVTADAKKALDLEIEAGPGLDFKPFVLTVLDGRGEKLTSVQIRSREVISIPIPEGMHLPATIRLHVDGGGKTAGADTRIMNFRVFEANLDAIAPPPGTTAGTTSGAEAVPA